MNRFNNIIYPNLIINAQYQQMRVTIPVSVDRTIVHIHCFRLKGAPDEMFHRAVRFLTTLGSPMSMIFSDDVEMLERCQQGLARDVGPWIDFSRGLGMDRRSPDGQLSGRRQRDADAGAVPSVGELPDRRGSLMLDYETQRRIELFLFEEARLLDAGKFEAWLKLYEPQGIYWMPSQPGQTDPLNVASIVYEDHAILSIRVQRLLEARALVLTPMPRTTHLVSNIEAQESSERRIHRRRSVHLRRAPGRQAKNLLRPACLSARTPGRFIPDQDETRGPDQQRRRPCADGCTAVARRFSVVQVKKKEIRHAILDSAYDLFSERGYHSTTLQDIAEFAGVGVSSLYSYFPSKLHLLYAVFEPWHKDAFQQLEKRVLRLQSPRDRLRAVLLGLWRDIPIANIGLTNSLMEALASADPDAEEAGAVAEVDRRTADEIAAHRAVGDRQYGAARLRRAVDPVHHGLRRLCH